MDQNDMKVVVSNPRSKYSFETSPGTYEWRGELPGFATSGIRPVQLKERHRRHDGHQAPGLCAWM